MLSERNNASTNSANSASDEAKKQSKTPDQINEAADKARYTAAAQRAPLLAPAVESDARRYRVFIHINSEADRAAAVRLQSALVQKGYSAPGIEFVSSAPSQFQVRYYYSEQAKDAKRLADIAQAELPLKSASIQVPPPLGDTYKSLPQGTMESWFPRRS